MSKPPKKNVPNWEDVVLEKPKGPLPKPKFPPPPPNPWAQSPSPSPQKSPAWKKAAGLVQEAQATAAEFDDFLAAIVTGVNPHTGEQVLADPEGFESLFTGAAEESAADGAAQELFQDLQEAKLEGFEKPVYLPPAAVPVVLSWVVGTLEMLKFLEEHEPSKWNQARGFFLDVRTKVGSVGQTINASHKVSQKQFQAVRNWHNGVAAWAKAPKIPEYPADEPPIINPVGKEIVLYQPKGFLLPKQASVDEATEPVPGAPPAVRPMDRLARRHRRAVSKLHHDDDEE